MKAAKSSHNQVVRMLIKAGADKGLKDEIAKTAKQHAKDEVNKLASLQIESKTEGESKTHQGNERTRTRTRRQTRRHRIKFEQKTA